MSRRTAQRNLVRATKFLSTLSRVPEIRAALEQGAGYAEEDHAQGWELLLTAMGYHRIGTPVAASSPSPQQSALVQLDAWDGFHFDRARSTLQYTFPQQYDYVFQGLNAASGADAIASVQTFIDRVVTLRDGTDPKRAATSERDRAAAQRLAHRKIFNPEIEAQLRDLLAQAKQLAPAPATPENEEAIQTAADALHVWLTDWRSQARAFVSRGDYLIRLGLSGRKSGTDGSDSDSDDSDADDSDINDDEVAFEEPASIQPLEGNEQ